MSIRIMVFAAVLAIFAAPDMPAQELWTSKDGSIRNSDTRGILMDGENVYLATKNEIYVSGRNQAKWVSIFFIPSSDNQINCISGNTLNIFVGTGRGLYRSVDRGKTWSNVFKTIIPEKSCVMAIDAFGSGANIIVIGTGKGVFISDDGGARWRDIGATFKNRNIRCISLYGSHIYVGADDGLYAARYGAYDWERLFVYQNCGDPGEEDEPAYMEESEEAPDPGVSSIAVKASTIYIASASKILSSDNNGKAWAKIPDSGLKGRINSILVSKKSDNIFCATSKGVFEYITDRGKWAELYRGIDKAVNVKTIAFASADETCLWAVTNKGAYRIDIAAFAGEKYIDVEKNIKMSKVVFDKEPSFKDLQRAAMRFNEVHPEKISQWRAQARARALAPKVTMGFDNSKSNTYEIYTSATRDYVVSGPDDISEGLDISVSWDLANLIWSDDQTNIDVRSRLTTQLRNDILDDLRRAYFERKRLQYELISSPPADPKLFFEKELRIQELTQAIDDLTGNYLTEHIRLNR